MALPHETRIQSPVNAFEEDRTEMVRRREVGRVEAVRRLSGVAS
jgi:hypothetical protein